VTTCQSGSTLHARLSNSNDGLHAVHLTFQHCGTACRTIFDAEHLLLCAMPRRFRLCKDSVTELIIIHVVTINKCSVRSYPHIVPANCGVTGSLSSATRAIRGRISKHEAPKKLHIVLKLKRKNDRRAFRRLVYHANELFPTNVHKASRQATSPSPIPCSRSTLITLGFALNQIKTNPYHNQGSCSPLFSRSLPG
jgi:hypothetical protein